MIEALASKASGISDATVWVLVDAVARNRPVSSAVIEAAMAAQ